MAPGAADKKVEKSYLSSAVNSINPWAASRSTTPTSTDSKLNDEPPPSQSPAKPDDHSTTNLYGQSFKTYPSDCPPLKVQWFHAIDVPKRKPDFGKPSRKPVPEAKAQPQPRPKKFSAFSFSDSKAIEDEYQKLLEATEDERGQGLVESRRSTRKRKADNVNTAFDAVDPHPTPQAGHRVPVNEDFLFDVDIETRELAPVYWLGPIYEVRRGTWFFQEGSNLRSCEENLAAQLEEGYLKLKPWLHPVKAPSQASEKGAITPKTSRDDLKAISNMNASSKPSSLTISSNQITNSPTQTAVQPPPQPQSHRLFGTYMNNIATYQDANTAWLLSESVLSWVTSSVYERFAGGGYMSGIKLVRGYSEPAKTKEKEKERDEKGTSSGSEDPLGLDERQQKILKRRSAPPVTSTIKHRQSEDDLIDSLGRESRESELQKQLSSLMNSEKSDAATEEEIRKLVEQEIQDDYNAQAGETQNREIEHLVLVTHGIGQLLSLRMESLNFVHDVNVLRKSIKSVYANSADLKALNSELEAGPGNCRVQVLPVCWRHLLEFPKQREKRREHDLGEVVEDDEDQYPSLEDITIEGVAFARSLISDLALDVLLYQSSYREQISRIVLKECNRIFKLFKERNPGFNGKVHLIGHSLGSAVLFDILCRQREPPLAEGSRNSMRLWGPTEHTSERSREQDVAFNFEADDLFCLGSPIGLFQMLKGRTIAARPPSHVPLSENPLNSDSMDDPFLASSFNAEDRTSPVTGLPFSVSSPKVGQLFNIFHPSDPISYRLEPLISPAMTSLKPQLLPYTKKGIFGNVAQQGLSGIGVKVGQSVSGLWSSLSAGIANNILNRSLGLTSEEVARMTAHSDASHANAASTGESALSDVSKKGEKADEQKKQLADSTVTGGRPSMSGNEETLIDDELETLFSQFQNRRTEMASQKMLEDDRKVRKMRAEEAKVRALNRNGRVDYSIQESVLDFNPINSIASHMSYWADEDVSHFVLSQLLSKRWKTRNRN